ncbi:hypothetical protein BH10ACT11_BH10ACT11_00580 [soil metagenome]
METGRPTSGVRTARAIATAVTLALLAVVSLASLAGASPAKQRMIDAAHFVYYESPSSVGAFLFSESDCVFGDHHFGVGGGVLLPFDYQPARLLNNTPVEAFGNTGGWLVTIKGKGADNPTTVTTFEICTSVRTTVRSASFEVPADGKAHSKTVSCGKNERALSGGVSNYPGKTELNGSRSIVGGYPVDGPDKGHARGDAWQVTSRASRKIAKRARASVFCVKASKMRVRYRHLDFVAQKGDFAGVYVDCKASEQVTGGGIQLAKPKPGIQVTTSAPFDSSADPDSIRSNRWGTVVDGTDQGKVDATNWAVCAKVL